MIPQQPQPEKPDDEFRITRWQLEQIAKYADLERIVWACLNKPSHPAPAPETISKELALELCMDARAEAAAQAREEAWKWIDDYADEDTLSVSFILLKINQLRQEAQR